MTAVLRRPCLSRRSEKVVGQRPAAATTAAAAAVLLSAVGEAEP